MTVVAITVGGKGSRVSHLTDGKSKSEIKILKTKSIIELQLDNLVKLNKNIFILSNTKNLTLDKLIKKKYANSRIKIVHEKQPLGTAGCLKVLEKEKSKVFLIVSGDLVFNINLKKLLKFHSEKKSDCTLVVHPNNHPHDSDRVDVDNKCKVKKFYKKNTNSKNISNLCLSGIFVINKTVLKKIHINKFQDFSNDVLTKIIDIKKKVFAYNTREYVKDAGTPERIIQVKQEINSLKYKIGNIDKKIPAIFLDKDGVINKDKYNFKYQNIKLILPNIFSAIKKINKSGYLCVLVTNQPAIAKGFVKLEKVEKDLRYLEGILAKNHCYLDRIYFCPCHPDKGFSGEVKKFKRICSWRKPNNGMLLQANKDLNIDFKKSYMIGDTINDYMAAKKTKVKFIAVGNKIKDFKITKKKDLNDAVSFIFNNQFSVTKK